MSTQQLRDQEQLVANMQAQLDSAKALLYKMKALNVPMPKWEPNGGNFYVSYFQQVNSGSTDKSTRRLGLERKTKAEGEIALTRIRQSNRLHSWIAENIIGDVEYKIEFDEGNVAIVIYAPKDDIRNLEQLVKDEVVVL